MNTPPLVIVRHAIETLHLLTLLVASGAGLIVIVFDIRDSTTCSSCEIMASIDAHAISVYQKLAIYAPCSLSFGGPFGRSRDFSIFFIP